MYAQVFENDRREKAHQEILRLLDTNHDGTPTVEEKLNARIIRAVRYGVLSGDCSGADGGSMAATSATTARGQASTVTGPRHLTGAAAVKLLFPPRPPTGDSF